MLLAPTSALRSLQHTAVLAEASALQATSWAALLLMAAALSEACLLQQTSLQSGSRHSAGIFICLHDLFLLSAPCS